MFPRLLDKKARVWASQYPVITITGPRQSGKTTFCKNVWPQYAYVNLEDPEVRRMALDDPKGLLRRFEGGVILDEIQRVPDLTSYIQVSVDQNPAPGRFILTGSHQFELSRSVSQSLAGRTALCTLLPLSWDELADKGGAPSISERIYQGFYPRVHSQGLNPTEAMGFYLRTYLERDLRDMLMVKDLNTFERFLRTCAAHIGQTVNYSKMAGECGVDHKTASHWISILEASCILFTIGPHFANLKKRIIKARKMYFVDTGLASLLLGITDPSHVQSHPLYGALFENMVVAELLKRRFNKGMASNLYYYRNASGQEVDVVLDYGTSVTPVEIKVSQTIIPRFFETLNWFKEAHGHIKGCPYLIYGGEGYYEHQGVKVEGYDQMSLEKDVVP